jgi:hypothetical protein
MTQNKQFALGRNPSKFDARDYRLGDFMPKLATNVFVAPDTKWEFLSAPLNQGDTPHCVGFSIGDFGICLPVQDFLTNKDGHNFYYACKIIDQEPNQENGSNIRSAAKVMQQNGMIETYAFASSINEIKWWLVNKGPMVIGTTWTNDMFSPDSDNIIHITGGEAGGHAYLINEVRNNSLFGIQNSWGDNWGINGKAYIPISEFTTLFRNGGEAISAVELSAPISQPKRWSGCLNALISLAKPT